MDLGTQRVRQGIHGSHSVRAGMVLTEQVLLALDDFARRHPGVDEQGSILLVRALQRAIALRVEAGARGYDTFVITQVRELNDQGRRRLAREIHDKIGNELSLAMRQLELYEIALAQDPAASEPVLGRIRETLGQALGHTRDLITELRRPVLVGTLETALRAFTQSFGDSAPAVQIWVHGTEDWLPTTMHDELFLIVRECLRNSFTHAGSSNIVVHIGITPDEVSAEVIDDGRGFDLTEVQRTRSTNGLSGLRERVDLLGGVLKVDSVVGRGTRASVWLPIRAAEEVAR
ncbi:MAG TPA: histidine kinase [Actinocrinis sp.]|nr:histidine kinase [Actinocrinis sp.]